MTEDQVFLEFLNNFGDVNKDGTISREVFQRFYVIICVIGME